MLTDTSLDKPSFTSHLAFEQIQAQMQTGDTTSALESSKRLCDAFPGDPEVLDVRASILMEHGEIDRARKLWGLVIDLLGERIRILEQAFDAEEVDWDDVVEKSAEFEAESLRLLSLADRARLNAAICLDKDGDRAACVADLERAVADRPESVYLHAMLAVLLVDEGRQADAQGVCRAAVALPHLSAFSSDWLALADACETSQLHSAASEIRERYPQT